MTARLPVTVGRKICHREIRATAADASTGVFRGLSVVRLVGGSLGLLVVRVVEIAC